MTVMLHRLNVIEEIGRFAKLTHKAEPLTGLSLIFARNGYGKSTICAILRSASEGDSSHIYSRRRLGASADSRVQTAWASGVTASFSLGKWSACPSRIHIFDQEYISKNIHVGDCVTRDNKRSLLPVVLGDQGVKLADEVNRLDAEQRKAEDQRKESIRTITARCKGIQINQVDAFCKAEVPSDLTDKVKAAEQRLALIKQAQLIKQKKNPLTFQLGQIDNAAELLQKSIDGISQDAVLLVQQHLSTHELGPNAHAWLQYGNTHAPESHCPFCAQSTDGLPLVSAYQVFFSEGLKLLKSQVDSLFDELARLTPTYISGFLLANETEFMFWKELCDLPLLPMSSPQVCQKIDEGLSALRTLVEQKRASPLEAIEFGNDQSAINLAYQCLRNYNHEVVACGTVIDQARAETASGDITTAEITYSKWLAMMERLSDPVKTAVADYIAADVRLSEIKNEKISAQKQLTEYTKTTMKDRQAAVNEFLADFGASFRIVDAKTNFVGREPNTEFAIELGSYRVKAGDISMSEPSFKTVLSAGDKTTLALALFFAQVLADSSLPNTIVVFDDPFNSQDMDRQFQTTSHIRALSSKACQVIVLSHDPRFLQLIEKNADSTKTKTFQLQCSDAGDGSLQAWSSADELKSLYVQQSEIIREFATHGTLLKNQTRNSIHQAIRPFLEDYLRVRFPGRFQDQAHIFDMANSIKAAGPSDPMAQHVQDLLALNEYTRSNMHGGGIEPNQSELRAHCRKVLKIVGSY